MFRRSTVRYGDTPPAESRYMAARQIWDGRIGSAVVQARNWRLAFFTTAILCGGMAAGWFWQSERGTVVPWVVQVDKLGNVEAQGPATGSFRPTDPIIARDIANFIKDVRNISTDAAVVRADWLDAYKYLTDRGKLALNDYAQHNDPFSKIGKAGVIAPGMPAPATPEQQRVAQERDAARTSHLFATPNISQSAAATTNLPAAPTASAPTPSGGSADQDHKLAFLNATADHQTESPDRLQSAASPTLLQAGAVIPAALITGIRSDLPGQVTAQVTEDVYDSPTGKILLIPQGARLIGQYDAQITFGQSRALLVWNRLILPNGNSIVLERQPGTGHGRLCRVGGSG